MKRDGDSRDWHYLTRLKSTEIPSNLLFVDTETYPIKDAEKVNREWHHLRLWCAYACRLEQGETSRDMVKYGKKAEDFWQFVESRLDRKRPLWLFAHNLGFDMTILDLWRQVIAGGFEFCQRHKSNAKGDGKTGKAKWTGIAVMNDPPTIMRFRLKGTTKTIVAVDTYNYFRSSLRAIGESIGIPKSETPPYDAPDTVWIDYCLQDVKVLQKAVIALMAFVRENDLGKWSYTISSQAMAAFRTSFLQDDRTILVHGNGRALQLERDSYHSGAVHCWYVGCVGLYPLEPKQTPPRESRLHCVRGPVYHLDVQSFYPSIMADEKFPVRLKYYSCKPGFSLLQADHQGLGLIAAVKLNCIGTGYPVTRDGRTFYAQGRFVSTLCGPELLRAYNNKHVVEMLAFAAYEMEPIFADFSNFFINMRREYKRNGNLAFAQMCKLIGNSLYGKFGQWRHRWDDKPNEIAPKPFGEWTKANCTRGGTDIWRSICWLAQVKGAKEEHKDSCPAIASFVTAYGRERILGLAEVAGLENCLYSDTDSLHVTEAGRHRLMLAGWIEADIPGKLQVKEVCDTAEYRGPKNYTIGGRNVIAGVPPGTVAEKDGRFKQVKFQRLASVLQGKELDGIAVETVLSRPPERSKIGHIKSNGRTEPPLLIEW